MGNLQGKRPLDRYWCREADSIKTDLKLGGLLLFRMWSSGRIL